MQGQWQRRMAAAGVVIVSAWLAGCARDQAPDAYGTVEADTVVVSAETAGIVRQLAAVEGEPLAQGATAAVIDATQLTLEQAQLRTQVGTAEARAREAAELIDVARQQQAAEAAQRDVLTVQRAVAERQYARTKALFDREAATAQQLDQAERELRTLQQQIEAQDRRVAVQRAQVQAAQARAATASADVRTMTARLAQLDDRLGDTEVDNPVTGTVLTTFVSAGELVQPGQRMYSIADLRTVTVRAYLDETQLASVRTGQRVSVTFDAGPGARDSRRGTITWIASQAEFTPTPVQTREERTGLVYAVKIRVPNPDGALKIGMPVDVTFTAGAP